MNKPWQTGITSDWKSIVYIFIYQFELIKVKRLRTQSNVPSVMLYMLKGSLISYKNNNFIFSIFFHSKGDFGPLRVRPIFIILYILHVEGVPDKLPKKEFLNSLKLVVRTLLDP